MTDLIGIDDRACYNWFGQVFHDMMPYWHRWQTMLSQWLIFTAGLIDIDDILCHNNDWHLLQALLTYMTERVITVIDIYKQASLAVCYNNDWHLQQASLGVCHNNDWHLQQASLGVCHNNDWHLQQASLAWMTEYVITMIDIYCRPHWHGCQSML